MSILEEVKDVLTKHTEVRYSPDGERAVLIDPEMYDAILEDVENALSSDKRSTSHE
jgi:hypothetical protein